MVAVTLLVLIGFAIGCVSTFFAMRELDRRFEKRQEDAGATNVRIPEVGDTYLILEHLWRVRSRAVYTDRGKVKYHIYAEIMLDETDPPFDGHGHFRDSPEFFEQWQFIGNPEKDAMDVKAMVAELALKHDVSKEEVVAALDSVTGEIDMSCIPERQSDDEVAKNFFETYKTTLTGHAETDEKNRRSKEG